jgi:hypothetical protein
METGGIQGANNGEEKGILRRENTKHRYAREAYLCFFECEAILLD